MSSTAVPVNKTNRKWINASVAISAIVLGYTVFRLLSFVKDQFELEASLAQINPAIQIISVLVGIGAFFYVIKNVNTSKYLAEAFSEVSKVVFPDPNETVGMTIRVIILVTIIGIFLGVVDVLSTMLLEQIL